MAGTNISWTCNMLFLLLTASISVYGESRQSLYHLLPNGYNVYLQDGTQAEFKSFKSGTKIQCASRCMRQEFCHLWRMDNGYCHMFHSFLDKVTVKSITDSNQLTYYKVKEDSKWTEVYFLKRYSEFKVSESFLGQGTYTSWGPASCTQTFCKDFFRSLLIDIWSYLPTKKVKMSLFLNNVEKVQMIFDGQGTDSKSWFNMSRVLKSPWKDVYKGATNNFFGINYNNARSFDMAKNKDDCDNTLGWITVLEKQTPCSWSMQLKYPCIIYSNKDEAIQWQTGYENADSLAIYISI